MDSKESKGITWEGWKGVKTRMERCNDTIISKNKSSLKKELMETKNFAGEACYLTN